LTLVKVAKIFSLSLDSLVTDNLAEMRNDLPQNKQEKKERKLRILAITVDNEGNENIDLVPQKASAGYLNGYADPEFIEELPKFRLPMLGSGTHRAFEISGDSMLPISSGTVIVGRFIEDWSTIKDGTPCVLVTQKEGIVFKRVYNKLQEEAKLQLHSDNTVYSPYSVEAEDVLEVWEARAFISTQFPNNSMSLDQLASIVMDLKKELQQIKKAS